MRSPEAGPGRSPDCTPTLCPLRPTLVPPKPASQPPAAAWREGACNCEVGAEPWWGLMGDRQAPLNRILIIQLQQEFFPPWAWALTDTSISTSASSQPWQPILPGLCRLPSPTVGDSGLAPEHWGRAWHPPLATVARTQAPGEAFTVRSLKVCLHRALGMAEPTSALGTQGVTVARLPCAPHAHFSGVILPHARPFGDDCLV